MRREIADLLKNEGVSILQNVQTAPLSTIKIGGTVSLLIEPTCKNELITAIRILSAYAYPFEIIGRGSNVLFADGHIPIALIRTTHLDAVRYTRMGLTADAGTSLTALSALVARRGFADLAFAFGIPGTLGGALVMNAGAHGNSISDVVHSVTAYCPQIGKTKTFFKDELNYSYRNSAFQQNDWVVLSAELSLQDVREPAQIYTRMRAQSAHRRQTQPLEYPSAGSVFRRPAPDVPLSRIMDEIGCKGMCEGGAAVSQKHAGFIINRGNATAKDVVTLIERLQNKLEKERGIWPHTEMRFIPRER